jgi:endonuclease G, mitochondrial
MPHLTNQEIMLIGQAAVDANLTGVPRPLLLNGIPGGFVAGLSQFPSPIDQFNGDLVTINAVDRLADGQVPIVTFLDNAVFQLRLRQRSEAKVIEGPLNRIGNVAAGVSKLPEPTSLPEVIKKELIFGNDDTLQISFLQRGIEVAKSVARVRVPRFANGVQKFLPGEKPWIMNGTAWLIASDLAITNHHVIAARLAGEVLPGDGDLEQQAINAMLDFDFDAEDATTKSFGVKELLAASVQLDYALLALKSSPGRSALALAPKRVVIDPTTRPAVNIIQHPRGQPKRVAVRNNPVSGADQDTLRYYTDTDNGSSGSPVCDDEWKVVALHRGARQTTDAHFNGKETAYVNFGSQIVAVLESLTKLNAAAAAKIQHAAA